MKCIKLNFKIIENVNDCKTKIFLSFAKKLDHEVKNNNIHSYIFKARRINDTLHFSFGFSNKIYSTNNNIVNYCFISTTFIKHIHRKKNYVTQ